MVNQKDAVADSLAAEASKEAGGAIKKQRISKLATKQKRKGKKVSGAGSTSTAST